MPRNEHVQCKLVRLLEKHTRGKVNIPDMIMGKSYVQLDLKSNAPLPIIVLTKLLVDELEYNQHLLRVR